MAEFYDVVISTEVKHRRNVKPDALHWNSIEKKLEYWDGATWVEVGANLDELKTLLDELETELRTDLEEGDRASLEAAEQAVQAAETAQESANAAQASADAAADSVTALSEELESFAKTQASRDAAQNESISAAQELANAATQAAANAQNSADNAQASADAAAQAAEEAKSAALLEAVPPGIILDFAGNGTPVGRWLPAWTGAEVSRTTYAELFAAVGTTWGEGDGSTTFNLPNQADRVRQGGSTSGEYKDAGLPGIKGAQQLSSRRFPNGILDQGMAIYSTSTTTNGYMSTGNDSLSGPTTINIDASRSSPIYGSSNTVQMASIVTRPFIKY